jgi:DNA-binding beta-propeller fold protein YncE
MNVATSRATTAVFVFATIFGAMSGFAQDKIAGASANPNHSIAASVPTTRLPSPSVIPTYVGSYCADGRFRRASEVPYWNTLQPQREVPPTIDRAPIEGVVDDDRSSPGHVVKRLHPHSSLGALRDQIVTFIYGRQRVLVAPTHLVTDSHQRLIITDPRQAAVHVLDGEQSFRIQGGPDRRFQVPNGLAVDGSDNIYITQKGSPYILVYDGRGRFLRNLGAKHQEPLFQEPTSIAINPRAKRLYVLDSPMHELVILDLAGDFVKRIGGTRSNVPGVKFDFPTEIVVRDNMIAVLDRFATRVQLLDGEGRLQKAFDIRPIAPNPHHEEIGLAMDSTGHVYVSAPRTSGVTIYDSDGHVVGTIQRTPIVSNANPAGMWVDPADRMYLTDSVSGSVHVFQRATAPTTATN